ncbi:DUF4179 domain-containing protein [Ureibacillus aquaedulcis]|uniref:DUF4179 domain-containing protein n=1 Tax=Ureibacillus aquaedulcis TaxID=3058421 RepID=A0ABT8GSK0_9BACL|nr:DUF4179 domain-containing protein [Ureibacillus sp. BA0131]MDN4494391.1 DUF4179 domain-containing protein [Ureibacillus sp. BA0131]
MERIEGKLKKELKTSNKVPYPDFDRMWSSIQQDELKDTSMEPIAVRSRNRKRFAMVAGLSVALLATPVYAALTYDWSDILSHRQGIESALEKGLGQTIEQSITKDGITLTVHTAFIDDNRTFLLYSLKPDSSWDGKNISFDRIGLKDDGGNFIEGHYVQRWNEDSGLFQGYFETDWIAEGTTANIEFSMEDIQFIDDGKQSINYDPNNSKKQEFQIQKDGIGSVTLQSFEQAEDRVLLQSSVTFTNPEMQNKSWVRIHAINERNEPIREAETSKFGAPGASGEYVSEQIFQSDTLRAEGTQFQLFYDRTLKTVEGTWGLDLALSKKKLENGSFREVLNIPFEGGVEGTEFHEMIVTPTQIRLILTNEKYILLPYMDYQLDVGGTMLDGAIWHTKHPDKMELRFEMSGLDWASLAEQPVSLIAKHRVDIFEGNDNSIRLTDISSEQQSITTKIAGYPVTWTYYLKDNNLYVESLSSDPTFGGVTQTYYLNGNDRNYGKPAMLGLRGDGNNKNMDIYENFDKTELDIYIYQYTTNHPNDEMRIPLKAGK